MKPRTFFALAGLSMFALLFPEIAEARSSRSIRVPSYGTYGLRGGARSSFVNRSVPYRRSYGLSSAPSSRQLIRPRTTRVWHDDRETAVAVQRSLRAQGYYRGAIDGDIGPASRRAIQRFQAADDLPATGEIDDALLAALGVR